jgi:hypothetical protein
LIFRRNASAHSGALDAQDAYQHLLLNRQGELWAYFVLDDELWQYQSSPHRTALMAAQTQRLAELQTSGGQARSIHLIGTAEPYPYPVWARNLDKLTAATRIADVDGGETRAQYLAAQQRALTELKIENPTTYLGVRLVGSVHASNLWRLMTDEPLGGDMTRVRKDLRQITAAVAREGFGGQPLSSRGLAWLMHSMCAIGLPVSQNALAGPRESWSAADMDAFTGPVTVACGEGTRYAQVTARRDGREHTRLVSVLTMQAISRRDPLAAGLIPWLAYAREFPETLTWQAHLDVLSKQQYKARAEKMRRRAEQVEKHHADNDETTLSDLAEAIDDAKRIENEVKNGSREEACRLAGTFLLAVPADNEIELDERVADVISSYAQDENIAVTQTLGQYALLRQFHPGSHLSKADKEGYRRRMPAYFLAAGGVNFGGGLGDNEGFLLGEKLSGGSGAYMLNPQWGPHHDMSGMCIATGDLGSGKTFTAGCIAENSARLGIHSTIFVPSGSLEALTKLPHLRGKTRHIDLSGGRPGTLNLYALIPDPIREIGQSDADYAQDVREAESERRDLVLDSFGALLPAQLGRFSAGDVEAALEDAVLAAPAHYGANPWRVVDKLERAGDVGQMIAGRLVAASGLRGGALLFPDRSAEQDTADVYSMDSATLIVMSLVGVRPAPAGVAPRNRPERQARVVLDAAGRYAARNMYAFKGPKVIAADEIGQVGGEASFAAMLNRGSTDSRKHETFFMLLSQNPAQITSIAPQIGNLAGMSITFRMKDAATARAALPLMRVADDGQGYENILPGLSTGQAFISDWRGRPGLVRITSDHRPFVRDALNSTPPSFSELEQYGTGPILNPQLAEALA